MIPVTDRPEDGPWDDDDWELDGDPLEDVVRALEAACGRPDPLRPYGPGTFDHHGFIGLN